MRAKPRYEIICKYCGKKFIVPSYRRNTAKYCSRNCTLKDNPFDQSKIKHPSGKNHPNWKNGFTEKRGYRVICVNGKSIREHRYVMEKYLNRKLKRTEHVHHINGNKSDNHIENLQVLNIREHTSITFKGIQRVKREPMTCEWCGKKYFKLKNRKTRRFCSKKCRDEFNKHRLQNKGISKSISTYTRMRMT